jgi:hypothetical protein
MIIIINDSNAIFRISHLQHIYDNQFTNIYGNIIKIKLIDCSESIENFCMNLPITLKELTLKQCNISTFPNINPEIEMHTLDISLNRILHLPDLTNYIHLKNLTLHSNIITNIVSFPPNLERLDISNNKLVSLDNYPITLNYFNFSSNLILFRPPFLNTETNTELIYNNNIFNIIPNNYEESSNLLLPEQNILFSEFFNSNANNINNSNNQNNINNNITPFPFSFSVEYEVLENNDNFSEINLDEIENDEIVINNPYKEITEKINEYLRNSDNTTIDIPNEYFCPISKEIMLEPVVIRDGYTYEKKSIMEWFKYSSKSPITSKIVRNKIYLNNTSLRNMIREWLDKNRNLIE